MKNTAKITIAVIILTIISFFTCCNNYGYQYDDYYANKDARICWQEVNVRTTPGVSKKSKIVETLEICDAVVLTGNTYEFVGDDPNSFWLEVTTENGNGWLTAKAVRMN